ncbi:MAG TPA: OmpA family protein [Steroidobacteraceae bacterium]|nr:OmpA family protein [Steroidobacteraceae bacterium]
MSTPGSSLLRRLLLIVIALVALPASAQTSREPLVDTLAKEVQEARAQDVPALAPNAFKDASEALEAAQQDLQKGRKSERIRERANAGLASIRTATQVATRARETFASMVRTRTDALAAKPAQYAAESWAKADERFRDAMSRSERGDANGAQRRAAESEVLMREAELEAIKNRVLGQARTLIAQAHAAKVEDVAPQTLANAERLLGQADHEISRNRYDLAVPESMTKEAEYEARHSIYLAQLIRDVLKKEKDDQHGMENMLLAYEGPLQKIAVEVNTTARFDSNAQTAMQAILDGVQQRTQELTRTRQELEDRNSEVTELKAQMQRLEDRLGGVSEERLALQRRVSEQEALRANAAAIEASFTPNEARVYRQGDDVVISLTGINFGVGRSTIAAASEALLKKVQEAIARFPNASFVVEGHTDANGSDSQNLLLSQDRADAVKDYLVRNAGVNVERISSIGYGEARPVASNETSEGRARNRRIDLIIRTAH